MPNPTELNAGEYGSFEPPVSPGASLTLSGEYAWQLVHTGYTAGGVACTAPVWVMRNSAIVSLTAAKEAVLLVPGMALTLRKGTTVVAMAVASGVVIPVIDLLSSRPGPTT